MPDNEPTKMKSTLPQYFISLDLDTTSADYKVLTVNVHKTTEYGNDYKLFSILKQSDGVNAHWYGRDVKLDVDRDHAERIAEAARLLKRCPVSNDVRQWIADFGAPIYVCDRRVFPEWVAADRVMPAHYSRWMAVNSKDDCCFASALAGDEDDARRSLSKAMGDYIAQSHSPSVAVEEVAAWQQAGRPVRMDRRATFPNVPTDSWLTPLRVENEKKANEAALAGLVEVVPA